MSANKTARREASLSSLPSPHRGLGFLGGLVGFGLVFFCVVLPAGAFEALKNKQVKHPQMVYLVLPLGFPRLPCHFPTGLGSAAVFMG